MMVSAIMWLVYVAFGRAIQRVLLVLWWCLPYGAGVQVIARRGSEPGLQGTSTSRRD